MNNMIIERWKYLYHLVIEIGKLEPWDKYWDGDLFVIHPKNYEEPFYCSIMGKEGKCYGISVYEGEEGLKGFLRLASNEYPYITTTYQMGIQNCLVCYYDGKYEQVSYENMEIIDKCGFDFDDGEYIYFVEFAKGYYPSFISEDKLEKLISVYEGLLYGLNYMLDNDFEPDFDDNEILCCYADNHGWKVKTVDKPLMRTDLYPCYEDDFLDEESNLEIYNGFKYNDMELVVDMDYLFCPVENDEGKDVNLLVILFIDLTHDCILNVINIKPDEDEQEELVDYFKALLCSYGKFESVSARNPVVLNSLYPICEALDIDLYEEDLEFVDEIFDDFRDLEPESEGLMS